MHKKLIAVFAALMVSVAANAQFEKGKMYAGASLSGLDLNYSGAGNGKYAIGALGGYMFEDNMMLTGQLGLSHNNGGTNYSLGMGYRYYFSDNGIHLGASLKYAYESGGHNDLLPGVRVGYTFFLNGKVTIEPELYYDHALFNFSDYSTIGFRIGIGVYL